MQVDLHNWFLHLPIEGKVVMMLSGNYSGGIVLRHGLICPLKIILKSGIFKNRPYCLIEVSLYLKK